MIGRTLSHYRLLDLLGEGGMGAVYLAEDTRLKRKVALKVLPEEVTGSVSRLERFQREAETLAALNHPNIVVIHSVEEAEGVHFLTMELVEGRPLSDLIPAAGLPLAKLFAVAVPLAEALAAAHSRGVTHRDLKPDNVMITNEDHRVKLLDLGLAKLQESDEIDQDLSSLPTAVMTTEGSVLGTLPYMSPEQAEGKPLDHRTDIFSLGVLLYELATGRRPFRGETTARLTSAILTETAPPVTEVREDLPRQLARIIDHCLEKEPHERFQSALDVGNELKRLDRELQSTPSAPPHGAARQPPMPGRRRAWGLTVALVALAVALGGYFWGVRAPSSSPPPALIASIVALPSDVFAPESEAYLTDAIPSTLSTHLAGLEGVDTKLPPTSSEIARIGGDMEKLAGVYQVGAFVRSSVTSHGPDLVLSVQIVETATKSLLWGAEYRGRQDAYLDLVRRAADGIRGYLRPSAVAPTAPIAVAATSEAELALERGKYVSRRFLNFGRVTDFESAMSAFEHALELDPSLAEAAREIGGLHILKWQGERTPELANEAERWLRRSLELDPSAGYPWSGLSYLENYTRQSGDPFLALLYALKGAALSPLDQFALVSIAHTVANWSLELGIEVSLESIRTHPLYLSPGVNAADMHAALGRADRGLSLVDRALEIEPQLPWAHFRKANMLSVLGRFEEAEVELEIVARAVDEGALPEWTLASSRFVWKAEQALAGNDLDEATRLLEEFLQRGNTVAMTDAVYFSWQFSRRGAPEQTVAFLLAAADRGTELPHDWWRLADGLEQVRADPRLAELLATSRRSFEEFVAVLSEAHARGELPGFLEEPLADLRARLDLLDPARS